MKPVGPTLKALPAAFPTKAAKLTPVEYSAFANYVISTVARVGGLAEGSLAGTAPSQFGFGGCTFYSSRLEHVCTRLEF